jgi:hypothetical protein
MSNPSRVIAAIIAIAILALLVFMLIPRETDTPTPTPTPTATPPAPTPTPAPPTPTPTPLPPSPSEALSNLRATTADLDAYAFTRTVLEANVERMTASGTWIAPGAYDVSVSLPACPPAIPGGPAPDPADCLVLHAFREVKNGTVGHALSPDPSSGEWEPGSDLARYDLAYLDDGVSPAELLLGSIELNPQATVYELDGGGAPIYRLVIPDETGAITGLNIGRESHLLHSIILTTDDSHSVVWSFTRHDEPLAIPPPFGSNSTNPIEWLTRKTIRLVENDPRFGTTALRPFLANDAPTVAALADALLAGTPLPKDDFQITGRVLTIHFTDGTRFSLSQAASTTSSTPIEGHWFIHGPSPVVVQTDDLTDWWTAINDFFDPIDVIAWPSAVTLDQPARFSGQGWPDQTVVLSTDINGRKVEFGQASTTQGSWDWEGPLPEGIQPGLRTFRVSTPNPASFVRGPESASLVVHAPAAFAIDGREVRVAYATSGTSPIPNGAPLWAGKSEHHNQLLELLSAIDGAPAAAAPTHDIDRTNALHIVHSDDTETILYFAGDCGVVTETSVCSDNRWSMTHASSTSTIESAELSAWWQNRAVAMPVVELAEVPEPRGFSSNLNVRGKGWPVGSTVSIGITKEGVAVVTALADLYFGSFDVAVEHPDLFTGQLEITVTGTGPTPITITRSSPHL